LASFWKFTTALPIVAYLDINNTLVAGGVAVAFIITIPAYFISKKAAAAIQTKYAEKIKGTKYGKWVSRLGAVSSVAGSDANEVMSNVKTQVKTTFVTKVKSAIFKPKVRRGILSRINIRGIAIVIAILAVIHFGVGLYASPAFTSFIVDQVNRNTSVKLSIAKANLWPLTLSCSLKDLKVFDPKNAGVRIAKIDKASVRVSLIGLLSKRLVFSEIHTKGGEINIIGTPDGSFNVMNLAGSKTGSGGGAGLNADSAWRFATEKKDLFGNVYEIIKRRFSKPAQDKAKTERQAAKKINSQTVELPKGRMVNFKTALDAYMFEIRDLAIDDTSITITYEGQVINIERSNLRLGRLAYDPKNGMRLDRVELKGDIKKSGAPAGSCDIYFSRSFTSSGQGAVTNITLKNVDLDAIRMIYQDSLPVTVVKGNLTLSSRTRIEGDRIDSRNVINLTQASFQPKAGNMDMIGFVPVSSIVDALNGIDPVHLKFDIKGTVDRPEFGGFQESLMGLIKPYLANIQGKLKEEGIKALSSFLGKIMEKKDKL
ncbi:MAG: hypothetical protein NTZ95_04175, partial [Candidatus Omnitrophica bacterium]|nr:hypothetical protein [Candidatus Omnitrophota bacterium]